MNKPKKKLKTAITISQRTYDQMKIQAEREMRTVSNMFDVLLIEALAARSEKEKQQQ